MAEYDYDVLVIGGGPGGYVATLRAALGGEPATQRSSVQGGRTAIRGAQFRLYLLFQNYCTCSTCFIGLRHISGD